MQFLYDNHGPYLKIYFNDNMNGMTSDHYELFDRNQHNLPNYTTRDGMNNFLPNTQAQAPYNPMGQQPVPSKNPSIQSSVIHHLVSSLGPNKTGSYSPFGETIVNTAMPPISEPVTYSSAPQPTMSSIPARNQNLPLFNDTLADEQEMRASPESSIPTIPSSNNTSATTAATVNVKKTRIVAEVKPMRMSYSDVVSKNGVNGQEAASPSAGSTNSASSSPNTTLPVTTKNVNKAKFGSANFDKKLSDGDKENQAKSSKKSPINTSIGSAAPGNLADPKKPLNAGKVEKPTAQGPATKKRSSQGTARESSTKTSTIPGSKTSKSRHASDSDDDEENSSVIESDDDMEDVPMEFYNVRKNVFNGEHHNIEKIVTTKGTSSAYKKVKSPTTGSAKKTEKVQKRPVKTTSRKRQKHEVLLKLCMAWGEYILKFAQWLWILIYDVFYLSCGIIWDRMSWCFQCAAHGLNAVRSELNGSPGRATWLWMTNKWKAFDGWFDKKSRWAFWRWLFRKKQKENEQVKDYYKDGKLPKTAEEAMKSLLNCKGKDAYR